MGSTISTFRKMSIFEPGMENYLRAGTTWVHSDLSPMQVKELLNGPNPGDLQLKDSPSTAWRRTTLPQSSQRNTREREQLNALCVQQEKAEAREKKTGAIQTQEFRPTRSRYQRKNPQTHKVCFLFFLLCCNSKPVRDQEKSSWGPQTKAIIATSICCHLGAVF